MNRHIELGPADHDESFLVLLPDRMDGRSVIEGQLGCPVCGRTFLLSDGILDTGDAAGTQFWERFATDFDALVKERGRKGTVRVTQIGGANDRDTTVLPDVRLTVGRKETVLPQANVFSKPVGDSRFHGLLGMDVLSQATEVTIDFRSMTLMLR